MSWAPTSIRRGPSMRRVVAHTHKDEMIVFEPLRKATASWVSSLSLAEFAAASSSPVDSSSAASIGLQSATTTATSLNTLRKRLQRTRHPKGRSRARKQPGSWIRARPRELSPPARSSPGALRPAACGGPRHRARPPRSDGRPSPAPDRRRSARQVWRRRGRGGRP